jgi:hypothetical protein
MEAVPLTPVASAKKEWNPSLWSLLCLIVGVVLLFFSPLMLFISGPLFLACFILSIIAMTKRRVLSGVLMMLAVFTIPPLCVFGLFSHTVSKSIKETAIPSASVTSTP